MNVIRWRAHIDPVLGAGLILILLVWMVVLYRRQRTRHSPSQVMLLLIPKGMVVILLILAYFDPVWSVIKPPDQNKKIVALIDTSSSMDVDDAPEGSRVERAYELLERLKKKLRAWVDFETLEFDIELYAPQKHARPDQSVRPTDLGQCLVSLAEKPNLSDYLAAVLFTDGGDELVESVKRPQTSVYIAGLGSPPDSWSDLALTDIEAPDTIEEQTEFEVSADVTANRPGTGETEEADSTSGFAERTKSVQVRLEEMGGNGWLILATKKADLTAGKGRAKFRVRGQEEPGTRRFRLFAEPVEGELTVLNNLRHFSVEVQKKTIHVLFYAQELGWDFRQINKELARDPSIQLTALFRISKDRFIVQGERQKGDRYLEKGFPDQNELLELYKCVIVGSFPARQWRQEQLQALREYVRQGGSVIFLGGEYSFGCGGYAGTVIAPLFPWRISAAEPELQRGRFTVQVPATAIETGIVSEMAKLLSRTNNATIESVNLPGTLRSGAFSLLNSSVGEKTISVVALQRFGEGRTLAVATNTLWKWTRTGTQTRQAYGHFWRQAVRHLTGHEEAGRFLSVKWDQEHYSPGERAGAVIRVAGRYNPGQLHLKTSLTKQEQWTWPNGADICSAQRLASEKNCWSVIKKLWLWVRV